jgi:hypothetical protein
MLSYKEYKLLNESLYGAFNLGLKSQNTVAGIVSDSPVNGTEASVEAESEEAIEEAKKMKKKMLGDEEEVADEEKEEKKDRDEEDEEGEEDEKEEEGDDEDEGDEDEDEDDEEDEDEDKPESEKKDFVFMKKKAKKEWSEVIADLEDLLEVVEDEEALSEVKKGLEMMKKGMEKGMEKHMGCGTKKCGKYMSEGKKGDKSDCACPVCDKKKDHEGEDEGEGLTAAQKKLPKALQDAIIDKKSKKKGEDKKCGKNMNEEDAAWWNSVNSMLGSDPEQKNWDGGWKEVGEVEQSLRDES